MAGEAEQWPFKARDREWPEERLKERAWGGPFVFLQLADTQLGFLNRNSDDLEAELAMARLALRHIEAIRPRFAIVCGDMVNAFPDATTGELAAQDRQVAIFQTLFRHCSVPLVCLCGNHEVGNTPTRQTIERYVGQFGDDYFTFWSGGVKCIVVNSSLFKDASACPDLLAAHRAWLERELDARRLDEERPQHVLLFSHIPPFIYQPDEPSDYFNIDQATRAELLALARRAQAPAWFCGHYHRNAGGWDGSLEVVVTSAVGVQLVDDGRPLGLPVRLAEPPLSPAVCGFRVVKVRQHAVDHKWYTFDALPQAFDAAAVEWEQLAIPR